MQSLDKMKLENKATLVRLDLNVPLASRGEIRDDFKIRAAVPTIRALLDKGARVCVASHLGRPHGAVEERLSLANVGEALADLLDMDVMLAEDCIGDGVKGVMRQVKAGELLLLENLRFNAGEVANSDEFAGELAAPFDVFVYDALACAHRQHASVVNLAPRFKEKCLGLTISQETTQIKEFINSADEYDNLAVIVGGRSFAEEASCMQAMLDRTKLMLVGGGVASTLLAAKGVATGRNKIDKNMLTTARVFLENAKKRGVEIILPVDHRLAKNYSAHDTLTNSDGQAVDADSFAVDIGSATVKLFRDRLEGVQRAIFCGPLGVSEWDHTARGSREVAQYLIDNKKPTIFGGGELLYQLNSLAVPRHFMKCTAGSALMAYLAADELPVFKQFADPKPRALESQE